MLWTNMSFSSPILKATVVSFTLIILWFVVGTNTAMAQAINEGFENVPGLPAAGWVSVNHSDPLGTSQWSQCSGTAIPPAQAGTSNSCILVNFNSTTGAGTISNWLITPNRTFNNGDTISFYTRSPSNQFPDRMQVRLSPNGASTNIGTTATDVGDFTTLLLDIDADYSGTYPTSWTQFTITLSGLSGPTSGRIAFRYFVENGGPDGANSNIIGIDTFVYTPATVVVNTQHVIDYNGDGKTDFSVVRNIGVGPTGQARWFNALNGTGATTAYDWGLAGDVQTPCDFDGDAKTDIAVWRGSAPGNSFFYILQSQSSTLRQLAFGQLGDDPTVIGDYDGDGKCDPAVYRSGVNPGDQSTWYYMGSLNNPTGNVTFVPWGQGSDFPAPGDYNGDGKGDFVVQRPEGGNARFWELLSNGTVNNSILFGLSNDVVVPGDYDGDGKTDVAIARDAGGTIQWWQLLSSNGSVQAASFGLTASDFPVQGDYDGDGKTDIAVWRTGAQGVFWFTQSASGGAAAAFQFGTTGDVAAANYNTH